MNKPVPDETIATKTTPPDPLHWVAIGVFTFIAIESLDYLLGQLLTGCLINSGTGPIYTYWTVEAFSLLTTLTAVLLLRKGGKRIGTTVSNPRKLIAILMIVIATAQSLQFIYVSNLFYIWPKSYVTKLAVHHETLSNYHTPLFPLATTIVKWSLFLLLIFKTKNSTS